MAKKMNPGTEKAREKLKLAEVKKPDRQNDAGELPDADTLLGLMKDAGTIGGKLASLRGDIGALVKNAEEDHNIHRGAFKLVCKLERMDPTKRAEFLRHLDHYRHIADLDDQPDLLLSGDDGDAEGARPN